ncbi:twin-arginine translocation signal domain-containing protein [Halomarina salina]|uniref:Twin-arginine translocation signal domain-containing protein n=1 Tax=Halomarina salina TaxID=1872699 RepID=A0ABD5RQA5_9EURY|nr:twin-arginine translocation signal domain-containing protein [Halomarina salina]
MSPQRRDFLKLGSVAAATAVAGCTGIMGGDENDTDETETAGGGGNVSTEGRNQSLDEFETTEVGKDVSVDGTSIAVSEPAVRASLLYQTEDAKDLAFSTGSHYLLAHVDAGEGGPAADAFKLVTGSLGNYPATDPTNGNPMAEYGQKYDPENDATSGWVGFTIPGGVTLSSAAIVVDGSRSGWRLADETVAALAEPVPALSLDDVDAPESVAPGEPFEVTATFVNDTGTDGTLRGLVEQSVAEPAVESFSLDVAAGESAEYTTELTAPDDNGEMTFTVRTTGGKQATTVTVGSGPSNSTSTTTN